MASRLPHSTHTTRRQIDLVVQTWQADQFAIAPKDYNRLHCLCTEMMIAPVLSHAYLITLNDMNIAERSTLKQTERPLALLGVVTYIASCTIAAIRRCADWGDKRSSQWPPLGTIAIALFCSLTAATLPELTCFGAYRFKFVTSTVGHNARFCNICSEAFSSSDRYALFVLQRHRSVAVLLLHSYEFVFGAIWPSV